MFTKKDYLNYFDEAASLLAEAITVYTDLLTEVKDEAIRNKLYPLAAEDMDAFRFLKKQRERFT